MNGRRTAAAGAAVLLTLSGCSLDGRSAAPRCGDDLRLALVAQSVPTASYVPCLSSLPAGWRITRFAPRAGTTEVELLSDRAEGRPVQVALTAGCDVSLATPEPPPEDGVRRYLALRGIRPRYVGTRYDVFPGGCVSYRFDFLRGPHITLMADLGAALGLEPRRELRLDVRRRLGVELDP